MNTIRPILFSEPMVRALLEGKKTQTRRIMKPQPALSAAGTTWLWRDCVFTKTRPYCGVGASFARTPITSCPYGQRGGLLWVKEGWQAWKDFDKLTPSEIPNLSDVLYVADRPDFLWDSRKRSLRYMPRWASRLTLEITRVRVEKLRQISETDAISEGFISEDDFHDYWFELNPVSDQCVQGDAEDDPWVWVIEFRVHQKNIDNFLKARAA